jgi:hypothetical protein
VSAPPTPERIKQLTDLGATEAEARAVVARVDGLKRRGVPDAPSEPRRGPTPEDVCRALIIWFSTGWTAEAQAEWRRLTGRPTAHASDLVAAAHAALAAKSS